MDRLTRPDVVADPTAVRFMDGDAKILDCSDALLNLILNGPTLQSVTKDTLRHLVRQLYEALRLYEELEMTPDDIEQTMLRFSSFLMEMTGGRMSKTNYTVQAMVAEANDYQQKELEEAEQQGYDLGVDSVLRNHFDIPWDEAADLRKNINRLRELMAAEKDGRLVVLPCKVGDTIYAIPSKVNRELNVISRHPENNRVYTQTVQNISFFPDGVYLLKCCDGLQMHHSQFFRESWFLTREEAEAALAKDNNVLTKEEE